MGSAIHFPRTLISCWWVRTDRNLSQCRTVEAAFRFLTLLSLSMTMRQLLYLLPSCKVVLSGLLWQECFPISRPLRRFVPTDLPLRRDATHSRRHSARRIPTVLGACILPIRSPTTLGPSQEDGA